jgi:hypothetical protein
MPSVTASSTLIDANSASANLTSAAQAGYAEIRLPRMTPAAARICAPWQIAAMGLFSLAKCCTKVITLGFMRKYSGARPPGISSAS